MRFRIHRGAHEIGGSCVEIGSQGYSILLDLGLPLTAEAANPSLLPNVAGLVDGSNPNLLGIILSHTHGDHYGLTGLVHSMVPVFMGVQSQTVLLASQPFVRRMPLPHTIKNYCNRTPFDLGPFQITPFLTDHSAFDAYSLLIEADSKRVFYSGDLRAHGRKARLVEDLLAHPPPGIDCLLLEGTTLSRIDPNPGDTETEAKLEDRILACIKQTKGLVLTAFSPQNIDRFVTIFKASRRAGRTFIADVYLAHLLDELNMPSLPRAGEGGFRVYLPVGQKRRIVADKSFDLVSPYRPARIYAEEIESEPHQWMMLFRDLMIPDLDQINELCGSVLIYSLWPGYLDKPSSRIRDWCRERNIELKLCHTSGHADAETLTRIAAALKPQRVVPIYTAVPQIFENLISDTLVLPNGSWLEV